MSSAPIHPFSTPFSPPTGVSPHSHQFKHLGHSLLLLGQLDVAVVLGHRRDLVHLGLAQQVVEGVAHPVWGDAPELGPLADVVEGLAEGAGVVVARSEIVHWPPPRRKTVMRAASSTARHVNCYWLAMPATTKWRVGVRMC